MLKTSRSWPCKSIKAIVAVSQNGVIGVSGSLPWKSPEDLKYFKETTLGSTVVMGRVTWESLFCRPLPGRRNIVITSQDIKEVECFRSIEDALRTCSDQHVWFIGGAKLYQQALKYCDTIDITRIPVVITHEDAVFMPEIDKEIWRTKSVECKEYPNTQVKHEILCRISPKSEFEEIDVSAKYPQNIELATMS